MRTQHLWQPRRSVLLRSGCAGAPGGPGTPGDSLAPGSPGCTPAGCPGRGDGRAPAGCAPARCATPRALCREPAPPGTWAARRSADSAPGASASATQHEHSTAGTWRGTHLAIRRCSVSVTKPQLTKKIACNSLLKPRKFSREQLGPA